MGGGGVRVLVRTGERWMWRLFGVLVGSLPHDVRLYMHPNVCISAAAGICVAFLNICLQYTSSGDTLQNMFDLLLKRSEKIAD